MKKPVLSRASIIFLTIGILILLIEWANFSAQYEDETIIDTTINIDANIAAKQKAIRLESVYKEEKALKNGIVTFKITLVIFSLLLLAAIYWHKKNVSIQRNISVNI